MPDTLRISKASIDAASPVTPRVQSEVTGGASEMKNLMDNFEPVSDDDDGMDKWIAKVQKTQK